MTAAPAYGALALASSGQRLGLSERASEVRASHHICAEGVRIVLPAGGRLTDAEAKRLAWGILNDLAPDEVIPVPEVVSYKEAQRLAVMRFLAEGEARISEIAEALSWKRRTVERRIQELRDEGRIERVVHDGHDLVYRLAVVP